MSDTSATVWWVFVAGLLASVLFFIAVIVTLVVSHRRYAALHRNHARLVLEAQEEEREWVSREVHDDAVQRPALIAKECGKTKHDLAPISQEQANRLLAIQAEVQDLGVFLRGLAHRLHPALIDRGGLSVALTGLCEEMAKGFGLEVTTRLTADAKAITPQRALVLYRIAQEALHNVAKHAAVSMAELELRGSEEGLELIVSDRGRGFEVGKGSTGDGIGLIGIQERAYLAEGSVEIISSPVQGTVVRARLPA